MQWVRQVVKHFVNKRGLGQIVSRASVKAEKPSLRLVSKIEKLKAEVEELMKTEENLREARQEKAAKLRILCAQMYLS